MLELAEIPDIESINLERGYALFTDGSVGRITDMMDEEGDDTEDCSECRAFVCEHPDSGTFFVAIPDMFIGGKVEQ